MSRIHDAAKSGDLQRLKAELHDQASCEVRDEQGWTPLMTAVVSNQADPAVVELLIDSGCDVNASSDANPVIDIASEVKETMRELGMDTSVIDRAIDRANENPPIHTPLSLAVEHAPLQKIQLLIERGADTAWADQNAYGMLIKALYRKVETTNDDLLKLLDYLISAGSPLDTATDYGESVLKVCSQRANTRALELLIERGADASILHWNDLFRAIAFGTHDELLTALSQQTLLEARDSCDRTPFLFAVQCGRLNMAQTLLSKGGDAKAVGFQECTALEFAVQGNHIDVMQWLIEEADCDVTTTALGHAVELDRHDCVRLLIAAGADIHELDEYGYGLMHEAASREVIQLLADAGLDLSSLPSEHRPAFLGLDSSQPLDISQPDYQRFRQPQFGNANPEAKSNGFWNEMVRTRFEAYAPRQEFGDEEYHHGRPVWCFSRFGQSMTQIPSQEIVEIAGEHEDHYDPDFCIYNDVVVHDGKGQFKILGYPRDVFPPTDFHTATYVDGYIYIIGNLGYPDDRRPGDTPVFRLNCESWSIESVPSKGQNPGWIHRHQAQLRDDGTILIWGGEICRENESKANDWEYSFQPQTGQWRREQQRIMPKKKEFTFPELAATRNSSRRAVTTAGIIGAAIIIGLLVYFFAIR